MHLERQRYIVGVLINGMEEEDEEEVLDADQKGAVFDGSLNTDFQW